MQNSQTWSERAKKVAFFFPGPHMGLFRPHGNGKMEAGKKTFKKRTIEPSTLSALIWYPMNASLIPPGFENF